MGSAAAKKLEGVSVGLSEEATVSELEMADDEEAEAKVEVEVAEVRYVYRHFWSMGGAIDGIRIIGDFKECK